MNLHSTCRYLGTLGVTIASEREMRKRQNDLLQDNFEGCLQPMLFPSNKACGAHGFVTRDVPFVYVKDLGAMILDYLDKHES